MCSDRFWLVPDSSLCDPLLRMPAATSAGAIGRRAEYARRSRRFWARRSARPTTSEQPGHRGRGRIRPDARISGSRERSGMCSMCVGDDDNAGLVAHQLQRERRLSFRRPPRHPVRHVRDRRRAIEPDDRRSRLLALYPPDSNEVTYNFGGGVKYPLSERFLARADVRRFQADRPRARLLAALRRAHVGWVKR